MENSNYNASVKCIFVKVNININSKNNSSFSDNLIQDNININNDIINSFKEINNKILIDKNEIKILNNFKNAINDNIKDYDNKFFNLNKPKNLLTPIEKSGSCALSLLVIGKKIYSANAGDSRALYSEKGSKEVYQISYEHKPHNEIQRIIKAGGRLGSPVLYGIWRLLPGEIAVSIIK